MAIAHRALLVVMDGLRPDAIAQIAPPALTRLAAEGAYTWDAHAEMPSITLPCHVSLFLSMPPEQHGVQSNLWNPAANALPGLFDVAHAAGLSTAVFYTWEELRDLARPGALDIACYHRFSGMTGAANANPLAAMEAVTAAAVECLRREQPRLTFLYLEAPDAAGHFAGWMSDLYLEAVRRSDQALERALEAFYADPTPGVCAVVADHGGHAHAHGLDIPEDMRIPWYIAGAGVRRGAKLTAPVGLCDMAPTLAHLLDLPRPATWQGRVVTEALA